MNNKPMIKHCYNCKYCNTTIPAVNLFNGDLIKNYSCNVYYNKIDNPRLRALFCKYFDEKEVLE